MKLNWFSPLPPAKTDVAHYTMRILPELQERAKITLWTDQSEWDPRIKQYADIRRYTSQRVPWRDLHFADVTFFNIGNNPHYHGSILEIARQYPGIVILHDLALQECIASLYRNRWKDRDGYLRVMSGHHGEEGRRAAELYWDRRYSTELMSEHYPLTHFALEKALGAVVHTAGALDTLSKENKWPLCYAPLPYAPTPKSDKSSAKTAQPERGEDPPFRLIVFGYIGPNRRLDKLLEVLANFPQRDNFRLDVYGKIWNSQQILRHIKALGLKELVRLHGYVAEEELDNALAEAHLAVNLRYPTMGEASGSQLRIWYHALPSLVTKIGWYADLPEEVVVFVRAENEVTDIQDQLINYLANPSRFAEVGRKGRRFLEEYHSPKIYVEAITNFLVEAVSFRTQSQAHLLIERIRAEINDWITSQSPDGIIFRMAKEICWLTGGRTDSGKNK